MTAAKKTPGAPTENEDLYVRLMEALPGIEIKGATMPYTSLNGNMFSFLKDGVVAIRLPEKVREDFLKKYKSALFEAYGAVMKEYVIVPQKLLKKTSELKPYFKTSYNYAKTLKTKPSRKK